MLLYRDDLLLFLFLLLVYLLGYHELLVVFGRVVDNVALIDHV